jgi:hypothetical protein
MRILSLLIASLALLNAEDITVQAGGSVTVSEIPGFIRISPAAQPPVTHVVRVGAISHVVVPRADRPGDVTVIVVPGASDSLRFLIPLRSQDSAEVLKAIAQASVALTAPAR